MNVIIINNKNPVKDLKSKKSKISRGKVGSIIQFY
jgi:hypothetical protein